MIIDVDTRKLSFKKGDLFIHNGKNLSVVSKDELLKPVTDQVAKLEKQININKQELEQRFEELKLDAIKGLISR